MFRATECTRLGSVITGRWDRGRLNAHQFTTMVGLPQVRLLVLKLGNCKRGRRTVPLGRMNQPESKKRSLCDGGLPLG